MLNAACRGWVGSFVLGVITCTDRANPTVTKADWDSSNAVLWTRGDVLLAGLAIKKTDLTKPTKNVFFFCKNIKVCTQLRIFQKEIKSRLNQELMHICGERG
jgi:hypothetical protein